MEHQAAERFYEDFEKLSLVEQELFRRAAKQLFRDLVKGRPNPNLNVKVVSGFNGILEMTWAEKGQAAFSGRATFSIGGLGTQGQVIHWRRVGRWDSLPDDPTGLAGST